jgi:uncharacterized protein DUF4166
MSTQALPLAAPDALTGPRHGLRGVLGADAWIRLPAAVRERFAADAGEVTYAGAFEIVRASLLGRAFAWLGTLFGTPVAPRCEDNVAARVHVRPHAGGVDWNREYHWARGGMDLVRSTKVVGETGELIERMPARLCMPLAVYEDGGVLHFVSRGYYFDLGFGIHVPLPVFFSPGVTHVEHIDLGHGWFRFTLAVMHPRFGEMFFQTGRFCAADG